MTEPSQTPDRLMPLLAGLLDSQLTDAQLEELREILGQSPAARRFYAGHLVTHALLHWEHVQIPTVAEIPTTPAISQPASASGLQPSEKAPPGSPSAPAPAPPAKSPVLGFLGGAIEYVNHSRMLMFWLMALLVGGWFAFQLGSLMMGRAHPGGAPMAGQPTDANSHVPNSQDVSTPPGALLAPPATPHQSDSVAWMTAVVDCHWRVVPHAVPPASAPAPGDVDTSVDKREPFHVGSELSAGRQLNLVRGLAEITFRSGARIVLNGPAHFTVGSPLGGKLQIGKLTARVPHDAHGFTVTTPAGKVVDLGTEFGVAVAADHTMEVEVFVGEVAVDASATDGQSPSSPSATPTKPTKVTAGHAARIAPGKPVVPISLDPKRFVRGLGPREDRHVAQAAYLDYVRSLNPVVWFRMEGKPEDRVLHDEMGGADAKLNWDGPGNPFVEGRVGKGLWLRGPTLQDYALVPSYPQAEHNKLSVSAWVYVEGRNHDAAIVSNFGSQPSCQFHFGLSSEALDLAVQFRQSDGKHLYLHEGAAHPIPFNEWQHVAFVTDGSTMRLYRQGREVASVPHSGLMYPVALKSLAIGAYQGNPGEGMNKGVPCVWDGKLDEIAIFNDALTADDIRKLAAAPPQ